MTSEYPFCLNIRSDLSTEYMNLEGVPKTWSSCFSTEIPLKVACLKIHLGFAIINDSVSKVIAFWKLLLPHLTVLWCKKMVGIYHSVNPANHHYL